ncbi:uncharacterized protein EV422DRAFT_247775 [Fimicolochytrium jonesii]|uniref:uncharacterized protein n=1 Tax=Fimicolochytrium jonesii TaxID=1396493 RepID=UPI0022FDEF6E|nr:uncharacterized protein EV422DRAFT_247775 [Fimicolochytrium jonesii]KAI8825149.1 hypothetical protein EV422DRAFT_247775 [Fimicolochytrium jonesii]
MFSFPGLTTCDHLLPGVRDELIIIFSLFLRDILDSLCIAGSVMNDILARSQEGPSTGTKRRSPTGAAEPKEPPSQRRRLSTGSSNTTIADEVDAVTVSPENGTLEDHRTTLCQELNSIVLDFCAAQPALVPIMILAYTRHCVALAEIMRGILPGLPAVFRTDEDKSDDGRSTQPAAGSERECKLWRRVLRADDGSADCAAGNALHMSYYFLHGLDKLVDVDSARDVEGYVSENLITLCNALLEDSLIRTPPEYSSYAFTICVKLEDYVGQARFSVSRVAAQLVSRCLDAGKE